MPARYTAPLAELHTDDPAYLPRVGLSLIRAAPRA